MAGEQGEERSREGGKWKGRREAGRVRRGEGGEKEGRVGRERGRIRGRRTYCRWSKSRGRGGEARDRRPCHWCGGRGPGQGDIKGAEVGYGQGGGGRDGNRTMKGRSYSRDV